MLYDVRMNTHTCIKPGCGTTYQSDDVDAYYCAPCIVERNKIAAQIDATIGARPRKEHLTPLQQYDNERGGSPFMRIQL